VPPLTLDRCLFAIVRMDEWVLKVSIAIPVLCIGGLVLWHLVGYVVGKLFTKPKTYRHALEPRPPLHVSSEPTIAQADPAEAVARTMRTLRQLIVQMKNDPEQVRRVGAALEDSLAEIYLELAESWARAGQHEQEAAALQKILQSFPHSRHALVAQERLRQRHAPLG
jgi:hypothetical protein